MLRKSASGPRSSGVPKARAGDALKSVSRSPARASTVPNMQILRVLSQDRRNRRAELIRPFEACHNKRTPVDARDGGQPQCQDDSGLRSGSFGSRLFEDGERLVAMFGEVLLALDGTVPPASMDGEGG